MVKTFKNIVGKLFLREPDSWFNNLVRGPCSRVGTAWWSIQSKAFLWRLESCRGDCPVTQSLDNLKFWIGFWNFVLYFGMDAFLRSPFGFSPDPLPPPSFQAISTTSQTAGFETDERHHHRRIVLQRSHWECTNRQCHPTHFKDGACRLQLSDNWSQPLKAEGTWLWTKFTVPSWDTRHQIELLLPGHLQILTLRVTKIQSIFILDSLRRTEVTRQGSGIDFPVCCGDE